MAENKNASGGSGGMTKIRGLKSKTPRTCRGVAFYKKECIPISTFLSREIFNFFYFSLNSFLFRSIVAEFPSLFSLAPPSLLPGPPQFRRRTHAALSQSSELHAGSLGAPRCQSPGPHRSGARSYRKARRAQPQSVFRPLRIPCLGHHRNARQT